MNSLLLLFGGVSLLLAGCSGSFSHTLRYFLTSMSDPDQEEPLFYAVSYLDEQPIGFFDVAIGRARPLVSWAEKLAKENPQDVDQLSQRGQKLQVWFRRILSLLANDASYMQSSRTEFHTLQVIGGCKAGAYRQPEAGYIHLAYDGEDFISFDKENLTWIGQVPRAVVIKWVSLSDRSHAQHWKAFLEEECLHYLQSLLDYGQETLQRTVPPTVKVACKKHQDGHETLLCRAYGFYPKEIEVSWMKDGIDQMQDTLTGGVIPNSDGTYHQWLSIDVDPKDRDRYRCHVEHDGLREPLDLAWEEPASVPHLGLIVGVLVGVLLAAVLVGGVIYYFIKDHCAKRGHKAPEVMMTYNPEGPVPERQN